MEAYLRTLDMDPSERKQMHGYIDFVRRRANGQSLYLYILVHVMLRRIRVAANTGDVDAKVRPIAPVVQG